MFQKDVVNRILEVIIILMAVLFTSTVWYVGSTKPITAERDAFAKEKEVLTKERDCLVKISQEMGVVRVTEDDHKRYVSFALRVTNNNGVGETPEFLEALESLENLPDLKGINMDGLKLTYQSLDKLLHIPSLEKVFIERTGLTLDDIFVFKSYHPNKNIEVHFSNEYALLKVPNSKDHIVGGVFDNEGKALKGAFVSIEELTGISGPVETDEFGFFSIKFSGKRDGRKTHLWVYKDGYKSIYNKEITMSDKAVKVILETGK